ncbi:DUF6867 family protein [Hyphomicrobium sulfonivorans]|uniref:DUF6867 domain-containing protein n=1 Tax=Hyphomicrobium sulfonivorans TaxID=121290 RepID=A0A109BEU1_HYPSL|nr:hypothetical protein [Hyphomicrobium sulfonivorans]KWT66797.1 hypothetical protein APY04_2204 [Hyphomicrobium sulfonivorans]MBI1650598.1 hypothetical protein [Hyphomicrobium sulfonivorans]
MTVYETGANGLWIFLLITVLIGGAAARAAGSAIASTWRPTWQIFTSALLLTFAVRFLHYALFHEVLFSWRNFIIDYVVVVTACLWGFRMTRVRQMVQQYPWAYERAGLLWWRRRTDEPAENTATPQG